jgi:hypothetical protein
MPVIGVIVPAAVLLLLQVPRGVASVIAVAWPAQALRTGPMGSGIGLTVIFFAATQPEGSV